ncbi:MAG: hypothetical protein A3G33_07890 [Omnitrophica bacterium RIFCSPLOWO2_12_FULL_44_17]|uniref:DJ-1/PfpI domain-containing protein n=1 Tax=Candidatus Danuiimicrobium aquiferis TaxID=1801832 RepID=A0A1G1L2Z4_9BACT|nr:MAG: hypothetical protein A3B72_05675 [Omnitrophica bacterium RIFCSPHIGHO2_02_FULL_45_28]OGW92434.1 MAG: hypothetical protein A3E74_04110 [Omnitrophica bacterium RIFCSPHIGHO2_12_FULL_44_12]OGW99523.1 MAG: hypothetical protein A3G33_07890 [Omnitrophica bacterium RIFCSPLOWO2_12_FULL_44_17]OGX02695.1 MAG: hypothetical protein A3J12_06885 [Omnitrophica bacterium RIFCSPLOWO2_02_FULL_44_11]
MSKKVLVILADGFEEIEAIAPIDILRRAGCQVTIAGLNSKAVRSSRRIQVEADVLLDEYKETPDALVLPGGAPGSENLAKSAKVAEWVKKMNAGRKLIGAICAAPALVLAPTGVLDGKKATCYPGCEGKFSSSTKFSEDQVVVDGNIVSSRGPGTAIEFGLELARQLCGKEKMEELKEKMIVK